METMHFNIAQTYLLLGKLVLYLGTPINSKAPMRKCPVVQGRLNWMPGYIHIIEFVFLAAKTLQNTWHSLASYQFFLNLFNRY